MHERVATSHPLELPSPILFDEDYWLTRCEGFSVEEPAGHLGVVSEVHFRSRLDAPTISSSAAVCSATASRSSP